MLSSGPVSDVSDRSDAPASGPGSGAVAENLRAYPLGFEVGDL